MSETSERELDPSEDELVAFARDLLDRHDDVYADEEFLVEAVRMNRDLWLMLYEASQGQRFTNPS